RPLRAKNAERNADGNACSEGYEYEQDMLEREAAEIRAGQLAPKIGGEIALVARCGNARRSTRRLCQKIRGDRCKILSIQFCCRVHPPHLRFVDLARELLQCG